MDWPIPAVRENNLPSPIASQAVHLIETEVTVNGERFVWHLDARASLLDVLRERMKLTGAKKGCNSGECGACTIHLDGRRVNACMVLAAQCHGRSILTVEGLTQAEGLHPIQAAFVEHDALQCGFCTPGQIMSALGCLSEGHGGSDDEVREWMSGNLCRCSCYPQIVAAVRASAASPPPGRELA